MEEIVLEIEDLSKTYKVTKKQQKVMNTTKREIKAVENLSFKLYKGEIFCLLGNNGAGKTTTLRMISTLIEPRSGTIKMNGNLIEENKNLVKEKIGFLTTELKLDDFFTPNYLFDFFGKMYHMNKEEISKRKEKLFNILGIDRFAEVKIKKLSTGMRQKVSIAISLVHNPEIIIFDEPTNGLDIVTTREIVVFLKTLKEEGKTILISTHIFDVVDKLADRVGIMVNGKLVYCENYREIVRENRLIEDIFFEVFEEEKNRILR
ncbi:MAG: ABC transporter ATP-binding protein [Lachnospiraceae bacterium]|nr:ABC transporter ATP-binding protein [Lachnospiraceae bacterium]